MARFLLLFVDGVGLGPAGAGNPLSTTPMPALENVLGGPLTAERVGATGAELVLGALDAGLGVPGLPQSATGQTALFTGVNAPALLGRHVAAFPGPRLAELLAEHSLLALARRAGRTATFANPYTPRYFREVEEGRRRHSATTLAALAAVAEGSPLRGLDELAAGRACTWDVLRDHFHRWAPEVEPVAAQQAGRDLAALADGHDLTLWETFMTDLAGHRRWGWTAADALARLDGLLAGLLAARPVDLTLLLTSDHGNLEAAQHTSHTTNPVPLLALGPAAPDFVDLDRLDQVTPRLLDLLS